MLIFLATMGVLGGLSSALAICRSDGFFVAHRNVPDAVLSLSERLDDRINAITDNTEDVGRAPIDQCFDQKVRGIQILRRGRTSVAA